MSKTINYAVVHFSVAFCVDYLMSGSVLVGGAIATGGAGSEYHGLLPT